MRKKTAKGRYIFLGGGGLGPQRGASSVKVSTKREGHTSRELFKGGSRIFPEFFNENFCDVAFHFSYRMD